MTRQTRAAATHWNESTTQEDRYQKISHRLFRQNHASKTHSPRLESNVVFHFLAASKAERCLYAMDGDFCCLCKRAAGEGRFTRSLWNRILMGRPQRKKKCNPFREPMMSPRIKNTFQWTGKSHACKTTRTFFILSRLVRIASAFRGEVPVLNDKGEGRNYPIYTGYFELFLLWAEYFCHNIGVFIFVSHSRAART